MKHYILIIVGMIMILLTSCSTLNENAMGESISITNSISLANEVTNISDCNENIHNLALSYTNLITNLMSDTDLDVQKYFPISYSEDIPFWSTEVCFCDIDFDGIPELFLGTGHGSNGINGMIGYYEDGSELGEFPYSFDHFVYVNSSWYARAIGTSYSIITQLCEDMPCVISDWNNFDTGYGNITMKDKYGNKFSLENVTYEETDKIILEYLGVLPVDLSEASRVSDHAFVQDYLRVPDPENYTEEDIYNCLLALLQEYEDKVEE